MWESPEQVMNKLKKSCDKSCEKVVNKWGQTSKKFDSELTDGFFPLYSVSRIRKKFL